MDFDKNKELAIKIKSLRNEKGVTQKELANFLGVSLSSVINYENSQRFPVSSVLTLMGQYFNVSVSYLKGESNDREVDFKWNCEEIASAVDESLPDVFKNALKASLQLNEHNKKMIFDIMVELLHTISIKGDSADIMLDALQKTFGTTTRFSDICIGFSKKTDYAEERLNKAHEATLSELEKTISDIRQKLVK